MPPLLSNQQLEDYQKNGFLIFRNLIDKFAITQILEDAKAVFKLQLQKVGLDISEDNFEKSLYQFFQQDLATFQNCGKQIQHLISLHRLSLHSDLIGRVQALGLQFPNLATRPVLYFNTKHLATKDIYYKVPGHQDFASMGGSLDSLVIWMPLVNIDKKLGALEVVPGSHRQGLQTVQLEEGFGLVDDSKLQFEPVELSAGDALFFSSFLIHRSGNNITDSIRWSMHFRFNNLEDPDFINRGFPHPYIYKPITKEISND